jgi:hypothetical protein
MKTFNDLEFIDHPMGAEYGGIISRISFDNGYGASIVKGPMSYGGDRGLYELSVLDSNGELKYDTPVTSDVEGYLSEEDVTKLLEQIQKLEIAP